MNASALTTTRFAAAAPASIAVAPVSLGSADTCACLALVTRLLIWGTRRARLA